MKDFINLKFLSKSDFNNLIIEDNSFEKTFDSLDSFDKNFKFYFKHYDIYRDNEFKLYNNEDRKSFTDEIQIIGQYIQTISRYFGFPGIGKSITIVRISKYLLNHDKYGTLYINCKSLNNLLSSEKYDEFKRVLIDEIPYLSYKKYADYYNCASLI